VALWSLVFLFLCMEVPSRIGTESSLLASEIAQFFNQT
jgi:hypothetical protein